MSLSSLSSTQLRHLIGLVKEKEALQKELAQIKSSLADLGSDVPLRTASTPKRRIQRRRRGGTTEAILKELKTVGKEGITVKDLAAKLQAKPASVYAWFYTTGKKIKGIKKVGPAKFAFLE